jgi:excisionase family DNA binding protein
VIEGSSYSLSDAAAVLGMSVPTVRALVARGQLASLCTPGGHLRIQLESTKQFVMVVQSGMGSQCDVDDPARPPQQYWKASDSRPRSSGSSAISGSHKPRIDEEPRPLLSSARKNAIGGERGLQVSMTTHECSGP